MDGTPRPTIRKGIGYCILTVIKAAHNFPKENEMVLIENLFKHGIVVCMKSTRSEPDRDLPLSLVFE